jgi:hypothetical protein
MNATRRRLALLLVAVAGVAAGAGLGSGPAHAQRGASNLQVFTTYHGLINAGSLNQGWWSGTPGVSNTNGNDSYVTLAWPNVTTHNFFTFDISHANGCRPESGLIALFDGWGGLGAPSLTYG